MNTLAPSPPALQVTERSEHEVLQRLQETVSASRLNCFLQCRLKFYFRYVRAIPKAKTPALHVGNSVHAALKAWHKARWLTKPLTLKQLHEEFVEAWVEPDDGKLLPVQWDGEEESAKLTGWRLCEVYLRESGIDLGEKPDAVEVPVEADLAKHGLPRLIGILDLVQKRRIIDYKTTSSTPNADKVAHTHEVQTSIYAVLYRFNTGHVEQGIELHHLVKLKNPKLVITTLPPMSDQQRTRLFRLMEAYLEGLDGRDFIPSPGMACASCEYFNECRQWH
ncbi:PD-(D/E)XK nuclease family protein [Phragmitibacter flavus]|uniref:PD-(D/E)XK nuclease family protein n=1 Tax=Phragmitibacter flavus TaxID=2576071 RepID=A0A5R8KJ69_9BACT|nr:PD-(D/E)XK nuclease family protein [Phragmitibacter flavus]TLD71659.1 PD-(D/E)XK nuclease family protein [Phragmitibacter flavus]